LDNDHRLVSDLKEIPTERFNFDVSAMVMDKILSYEKQKNKWQDFILWGVLILLLVVISSLSIPFTPKVLTIFSSMPSATTLLIIGSSLCILFVSGIDAIIQYKWIEGKLFHDKLQPLD
ncbi:MAG TPA: hypothetical protein PKD85_22310, partial [Saprospiraceae bacterium]|nr:hypothetical protein [Saprospiraceae bacterium]